MIDWPRHAVSRVWFAEVRSSLRRGVREGLFLRIVLFAPYRCKKCSTGFLGFSRLMGLRKRKKHKTLAGYLGFHGTEGRRFQRALAVIFLFLLLVIIALWLIYYFSATSAPPTMQ